MKRLLLLTGAGATCVCLRRTPVISSGNTSSPRLASFFLFDTLILLTLWSLWSSEAGLLFRDHIIAWAWPHPQEFKMVKVITNCSFQSRWLLGIFWFLYFNKYQAQNNPWSKENSFLRKPGTFCVHGALPCNQPWDEECKGSRRKRDPVSEVSVRKVKDLIPALGRATWKFT